MVHNAYLYISYIFGFAAVLISIFSFYPQFVKVRKDKGTQALSLYSYIVFVIANFCWLLFGVISFAQYFILKTYHGKDGVQIFVDIIWNSVIFIPYSFTTYFSFYILKVKIHNVNTYGEKKIMPIRQLLLWSSVGYLAGTLSIVMLVIFLVKLFRYEKDGDHLKSVSLKTYTIYVASCVVWTLFAALSWAYAPSNWVKKLSCNYTQCNLCCIRFIYMSN